MAAPCWCSTRQRAVPPNDFTRVSAGSGQASFRILRCGPMGDFATPPIFGKHLNHDAAECGPVGILERTRRPALGGSAKDHGSQFAERRRRADVLCRASHRDARTRYRLRCRHHDVSAGADGCAGAGDGGRYFRTAAGGGTRAGRGVGRFSSKPMLPRTISRPSSIWCSRVSA